MLGFQKNKFKYPHIIILIAVVMLCAIYFVFFNTQSVYAEWFDDSWGYRQQVDVTNSGSATTNQYVKITLDTATLITAGKMQSDCDDIRVTNYSGKLLHYFIDGDTNYDCNDTDTAIYALVDSIPTSGATMLVYYSNPSANNAEARLGTEEHPAISCRNILEHRNDSSGDGSYYIIPSGNLADKIQVTCDMTYSSGGWILAFHGLPSEAMVLDTTNESVKLSNNIIFNDIRMEGINLDFDVTTTVTETAQLSKTIPQYYYEVDQELDVDNPKVNFHDLDGNQDVQLTDNYFMFGYGNSWRVFYTCINVSGIDNLYIGGYSPTCTPRSSFVSTDVGCDGGGNNYCSNARTTTPVDSGLGLSLYEYQEAKVWLRENDIILNIDQSAGSPTNEEKGPAPVAYWRFDEGYGDTNYDDSPNNNDGTRGAGTADYKPVWKSEEFCRSGKCLYFDGSNDFVEMGASGPALAEIAGDKLTVEAWVRPNSLSGSQYVVQKNGPFFLYLSGDKLGGGIYNGTSWTYVTGNISLSLNRWHHLVVIYDGANINLYVNGVFDNSTPKSGNLAGNGCVQIGQYTGGGCGLGSSQFQGFIDDVKIYNYARSAAQIKTDYLAGLGGGASGASAVLGAKDQSWLSDGLVGYWKMDESSWTNDCVATSVTDSSGNDNDGTACPATTGPTGGATGKFGNAGSFDGVDDYVSLTSDVSSNIGDNITVTAWAYLDTPGQSSDMRGMVTEAYTGDGNVEFEIYLTGSSHTLKAGFYDGTWHTITGNNFSTEEWIHIVGTYDGHYIKLYENGKLIDTSSDLNLSLPSGTNGWRIGRRHDAGDVDDMWDGTIDELRIYNRAFSPQEVRDLYNWAQGPLVHYKFDEGSDNTINDTSGNGNTGTNSGGTWTRGKYGKALSFDGSVNGVSSSPITSFSNSQWIVSYWIQPKLLSSQQNHMRIDDGGTANIRVVPYMTSGNVFCMWTSNGTVCGTTTAQLDQWYHIAGVFDNGTLSIYVNGVKENSGSVALTSATWNRIYYIGSDAGGSKTNAVIDEFRLYNYPRVQKQIIEDMNADHLAVGSPVGSYVGYWKFDEGYGSASYDSSINNNDGTITGASWTNDGKFGKALDFNGSNTYVKSSGTLGASTNVTATAWIKADNTSNQQYLVNQGRDSYCSGYGLVLQSNSLRFRINTNSADDGCEAEASTSYTDTSGWHHVVGTYDGTMAKVYVDGVLKNSVTASITGNIIYKYSEVLNVGKMAYGEPTLYFPFDGFIDEVKIYPFALTEDEIKLEYNRGAAVLLGAVSTDSSGNPDYSSARSYCIPGDATACSAPVAEWKFDEKTGVSAHDTSGNGNTGTLNGMESEDWKSSGECKYGSCLDFDGSSSEYVNAGVGSSSLNITGPMTVETWVKTDTLPPDSGSWVGFVTKGTSSSIWMLGIDTYGGSSKGYVFTLNGTTNNVSAVGEAYNNNGKWTHIVGLYDSSYIKIYVNGQYKNQTVYSSGITISTEAVRIGDAPNWAGPDGRIDYVKIYNYARTPAQIAWDYNQGKPVAHWRFDECQGETAYDMSNNNDGTLHIESTGSQNTPGSCSVENSAAAWYNGRNGKYNSALSFDGTDDYVIVSDLPSLRLSALTISFWFKPGSWAGSNWEAILVRKYGTGESRPYFIYGARPGEVLVFERRGDDGVYHAIASVKTDWDIAQWYHIAVSQDGVDQWKIYVDGALDRQQTIAITPSLTAGSLYIGRYKFNNTIDEVRIYNYALTQEQIKMDYNQGAAVRFGP